MVLSGKIKGFSISFMLCVLAILIVLAVAPVAIAHGDELEIRINAGGPDYTDSIGNNWSSDNHFNTGIPFTINAQIDDTLDDPLYQSERYDGGSPPELEYTIPVPDGNYEVKIHFAEVWDGAFSINARVFDVFLEGQLVADDLDIYAQVGPLTPLVLSFNTTITDGNVNILLTHIIQNPKISAIEVHSLEEEEEEGEAILTASTDHIHLATRQLGTTSPQVSFLIFNNGTIELEVYNITMTGPSALDYDLLTSGPISLMPGENATVSLTWNPSSIGDGAAEISIESNAGNEIVEIHGDSVNGLITRIHAGGNSYNSVDGADWQADAYFNTGGTYIVNSQISNTLDDVIYRTERFDGPDAPEMRYSIPTPSGNYTVRLHYSEIWVGTMSNGARVFDVFIQNNLVEDNFDIFAQAGANAALVKEYNATAVNGLLNISFGHVVENPKIAGIELIPIISGVVPHLAHSVPGPNQYIVDIDNNGIEQVHLDAHFSHTHALGKELVIWSWRENNVQIASGEEINLNLSVGIHNLTLVVEDDGGNTDSMTVLITITSPNNLPGLVGYYYAIPNSTTMIPDFTNMTPQWGQIEDNINVDFEALIFKDTPFFDNFAATYTGFINASQNGTYEFTLASDEGSKLYIDGNLLINNDGVHTYTEGSGTINLTKGMHAVRIEYFEKSDGATLVFYWKMPGSPNRVVVPKEVLSHDHASLIPVVNYLSPEEGFPQGGELMSVNGFGFISPKASTTLTFANNVITNFTIINDKLIKFTVPPGNGLVNLTVATLNGLSNPKSYLYSENATPQPRFEMSVIQSGINGPTSLAWGPDGKLYVGTAFGEVWILTLNADNTVNSSRRIDTIKNGYPEYRAILGLGFNPAENGSEMKLYVSHSNIFHAHNVNIYGGMISILTGNDFQNNYELITGLPISEHDHGVDQFEFDINDNLYIALAGMTNAGMTFDGWGSLDESPLSGAVVVAYINRPNFDGHVTYSPVTPVNTTQTGGLDVEVFVAGLRNAYDIVEHSNGFFYGTDNGPNPGFGDVSTSCTTSSNSVFTEDELNLLERGKYYGHPNRNRGRNNSAECKFYSAYAASNAEHTAPILVVPSSTNGILEYKSNLFKGQLRNHLILSRLSGELFDVRLTPDGRTVVKSGVLSSYGGLDVIEGKDGSLFVADYDGRILLLTPVDYTKGDRIISVTPYRAPMNQDRVLEITGNFNASESVSVMIGQNNCPVLSFSNRTIKCVMPYSNTYGNVNVTVTNGQVLTLTNGFQYMNFTLNKNVGAWQNRSDMPIVNGEISAAAIGIDFYIFGGSSNSTYKYNTLTDTWTRMADQNVAPITDHTTAQAINGKIYAFGGLPASNALFIYDPANNSWSLGAPLMRNGSALNLGSVSSAVINNNLYIAGGISNGVPVNYTFVYYPSNNTWQELAQMPFDRNHAAGVGYNGKFYVFTGRTGPNIPSVGSNISQVYDPVTNTWDFTTVARIPTPRGGMGAAVELNGELVVIGGEGNGPFNGTFNTVEAYNPVTNTWRKLPNMTTPRHGIYPVVINGNIYVASGGMQQAFSQSNKTEVYITNPFNITNSTGNTTNSSFSIRIHAGGANYTDSLGRFWQADAFFNTGGTYIVNTPISGTVDDAIYQTERFDGPDAPEMRYSIPVPNGNYTVRLHYSEIWVGTMFVGARVFDVFVQNTMVEDNFDVYAQAGANASLVKQYNATVNNGLMNISFGHVIENPKIAGIELIRN